MNQKIKYITVLCAACFSILNLVFELDSAGRTKETGEERESERKKHFFYPPVRADKKLLTPIRKFAKKKLLTVRFFVFVLER